jgi:AraC-like DNA-binding protein
MSASASYISPTWHIKFPQPPQMLRGTLVSVVHAEDAGQLVEKVRVYLCRIARAGERTLDNAFMERFGLSPALYMKIQRLNGARHDLSREHEPSMSITDVANKWGFWHLGQFARDYRSWFCELPSATYKRRHHTAAPSRIARAVTIPSA